MTFDIALAFVLKWEGGYTNHPADRGGRTNFGVTQNVLDQYRRAQPNFPAEVADLTQGQAAQIFREMYWDQAGCSNYPEPLDLVVFDSAVQHGVGRAVKWLQRVAKTKEDGMAGPLTKQLVQHECGTVGVHDVVRQFLDLRHDFYADIVEKNPSQLVFAKGWANRMGDLERQVA